MDLLDASQLLTGASPVASLCNKAAPGRPLHNTNSHNIEFSTAAGYSFLPDSFAFMSGGWYCWRSDIGSQPLTVNNLINIWSYNFKHLFYYGK
jgi:hypothetical protein